MPKREIDFSQPKVVSEVLGKLIANTPAAYIILDRNLRVHFINEHFSKQRKISRDQILGTFCYNAANNGVPCDQCVVQQAIITGKRQSLFRQDIHPDGTAKYLHDYAIPLADSSGKFDYILEVVIDRTDERMLQEQNSQVFLNIIATLAAVLDKKDPYTSTHSHDVTEISAKLGRRIGLSEEKRNSLRLASLLHDIGKIYIPDGIINKPTRLSEEEYLLIRRHPAETLNILDNLSQFAEIRLMAGHHHERWDGAGYPHRLRGNDIPLGARIIAIADAYDAMTSTRSYRRAMPHEYAVQEIGRHAGSQFDPDLASEFVQLAQDSHDSRQSLISEESGTVTRQRRTAPRVVRRLSQIDKKSTRMVHSTVIRHMLSQDHFFQDIMKNSPAYYMILDDAFNILYASENLIRDSGLSREDLTSRRCFELNDKKLSCFTVQNGALQCPMVRAFQTGMYQTGTTVERFRGREAFCETHAVPIDIQDVNGESFRCVMQILFDRTREITERNAMKNDTKTLLEMLYRLIANLDAATTRDTVGIIRECNTFQEYLAAMNEKFQQLRAPGVDISEWNDY